jgi:hypothetical protein
MGGRPWPNVHEDTRGIIPQRAWLEHFPPHCRSPISNWFHNTVRGGATTPAAVLWQVQREAQGRLGATGHVVDPYCQAILDLLQTDRAGALAYAEDVLAYERLPREERQRVKAERAAPYLQKAMRGQPVTAKQTAYLRALKYAGPPPEDRAAASALIDSLTREGGRP